MGGGILLELSYGTRAVIGEKTIRELNAKKVVIVVAMLDNNRHFGMIDSSCVPLQKRATNNNLSVRRFER